MVLKYSDILNRCKDISAYEGGRIVDATGNSMFSVVRITDQDETLLKEYANRAALILDKLIHFAIEETVFNEQGISFYFVSDTTLHGECTDIEKTLESIIVSFIMWHWLGDKNADRSQVWQNIYNEMLRVLPKGVVRKRPKLDTSNN